MSGSAKGNTVLTMISPSGLQVTWVQQDHIHMNKDEMPGKAIFTTSTPIPHAFNCITTQIILDQCYGKHLKASFSEENKSLLFLNKLRRRLKLHKDGVCGHKDITVVMMRKLCLTSQELSMLDHTRSCCWRQLDPLGKLTKEEILQYLPHDSCPTI